MSTIIAIEVDVEDDRIFPTRLNDCPLFENELMAEELCCENSGSSCVNYAGLTYLDPEEIILCVQCLGWGSRW